MYFQGTKEEFAHSDSQLAWHNDEVQAPFYLLARDTGC